ncbi:hypothetical protein, partial [Micromonospora craterilacus]|uniref:hypothetical protein n=1 Tax=Micromonospora craterilacus TaxID=1655439 RepID=UPI001F15D421
MRVKWFVPANAEHSFHPFGLAPVTTPIADPSIDHEVDRSASAYPTRQPHDQRVAGLGGWRG